MMEVARDRVRLQIYRVRSGASYRGRVSYDNLKVSLGLQRCARANQSGRSAAWLARLVRDQEVDGSNPFAPTTLLESATYKMRKSIERLVRSQEVIGPSAFAPSILSPLKSMRYVATSTGTSPSFLRTIRTTSVVLLGSSKSCI